MKVFYFTCILIYSLIFVSCGKIKENNKQIQKNKNNSDEQKISKIIDDENKDFEEKRINKMIERKNLDSLRQIKILNEAIETAKTKSNGEAYHTEYFVPSVPELMDVKVNIICGHLFSNNFNHLLIRRITVWDAYLDIYLFTDSGYNSVVHRFQDDMSYQNDTIRDINGDRQPDYLVHWYPSSGCCRRNVYNVYLYKPETGNFSNDYEFINPTFFPDEKLIRGVEYGHPGSVELYKYKWNGFQVDTIEYIYPDKHNKINRSFIKSNRIYPADSIQENKISTIPDEYLKIESIDWFNNY